jgi:hypothetical protein
MTLALVFENPTAAFAFACADIPVFFAALAVSLSTDSQQFFT